MTGTASRVLTAAYPPPIRRRWGSELMAEIEARGAPGWLDSIQGAVRLWLRPAQWPAVTGRHLRRAAVVLAFATTAATALGIRGVPTTTGGAGGWLTVIAVLTQVAGLIALVPLPRRNRVAGRVVLRTVSGSAIVVCLMVAGILTLARWTPAPSGPARAVETAWYWLVLLVVAAWPAFALSRVPPDHLLVPGPGRAQLGLAIVVGGQTFSGLLSSIAQPSRTACLFGLTELILALITGLALTDLRRHHLAQAHR